MTDRPKLLKARQLHSRIFAVIAVLLVMFCEPWLSPDSFLRWVMTWLGYVLVAVGAMGRVYCSVFIGGRKNDEVIRTGMFSVVRNPLYVFSFIALVGIGLQSGMIIVLSVLVAAFALYYPHVVEKEEAFLKHKFGEPYETYMREVPRWNPDFSLWNEPEHVDAKPKFIRRTIGDALIFFVPMPCFALLHYLHAHEILPAWLTLL